MPKAQGDTKTCRNDPEVVKNKILTTFFLRFDFRDDSKIYATMDDNFGLPLARQLDRVLKGLERMVDQNLGGKCLQ